jgi:hypothetical protein
MSELRTMMQIMRSSNHNDNGAIVMASPSLSPKRAQQRLLEHRRAVIALAHQRAKRRVQASIRAKGQRLGDFSAREIALLAEDYLAQHRAELVAEAEHAIATWPGFARWRLPPGHEVFVKLAETEHSLATVATISGPISND